MWNRRKDEEYSPRPPATPPVAPEPVKESYPMSTMPTRITVDPPSPKATIGKAVVIKGEIHSREDLVIDGEIEGNIQLQDHELTIGPNGKVRAGIAARQVVVLGNVQGNVEATDKIDIRKDAKLVGDLKASRIQIEDGAYFKGSIDIVKQEPPKQAPKPAPAAAPAQPAAPAPAAQPAGAAPAEAKR